MIFPWQFRHSVDRERTYTAFLGYVRLKGFSILPAFVRYSWQIEKQLRQTPGVVGYALAGNLFTREFHHISAWEDLSAIETFVRTQPHVGVMKNLTGRLGDAQFRSWTVEGAQLPLVLKQELHRLDSQR